ncbi:unnamed protein product [Gongylonema pulchrum]|uniref:ZP domain-containing protein n=1 Tax=Gongylonema pulchrum TaxID=637853 RepID=A0A3P6PH25_9BILA|nr:unnamed protein product [Gongylonema pulchrum]
MLKSSLSFVQFYSSSIQFIFQNFVTTNVSDNGILGDPFVDCGDNYIEVRFETRNTFSGLVFVEDHLTDPSCRSVHAENISDQGRNASIKLGFKSCDIERRRSNNPRGMFVTTSIIVAFHPEFLTKNDRVYVVQCFYMELKKVLEKEIQVRMNPPPLQTEQMQMPVCRYEVLDGSPTGPPIFYAVIGQMVYHKWTCDSDSENQFCMLVHSCFVDDGNGDRVQLIDQQGCAKDKYLLQNLEYVSDLMAGKEAHVYKYADRQSMFFDCQIALTIKEPEQQYCTIPSCPEPPRRKRAEAPLPTNINSTESTEETLVDDKWTIVPNKSNNILEEYELEKSFIIRREQIERVGWFDNNFDLYQDQLCMSSLGFGTIAVMNLVMISTSALFFYGTYKQEYSRTTG